MAVNKALETGYRHIDAAAIYGNEASVGRRITESALNRADLFVTSKVWNDDRGYKKTLLAFEKSLSDLHLDYLDLYLIHWPAFLSRKYRSKISKICGTALHSLMLAE